VYETDGIASIRLIGVADVRDIHAKLSETFFKYFAADIVP
jgi:hypothetical protein